MPVTALSVKKFPVLPVTVVPETVPVVETLGNLPVKNPLKYAVDPLPLDV